MVVATGSWCVPQGTEKENNALPLPGYPWASPAPLRPSPRPDIPARISCLLLSLCASESSSGSPRVSPAALRKQEHK